MLPGMDWTRFAVAGWGESMPKSPGGPTLSLFRAGADHFGSILRVWDIAWQRGYRRIGVALFELRPGSTDDVLRWGGVQACLRQVPKQHRVPPFVRKVEVGESLVGVGSFRKWVDQNRPDAVIGFNAYFLVALRRQGFRVPADMGFASLHVNLNTRPAEDSFEDESGMEEVRLKSMMAAIDLLDQQIRHHQYGLPPRPRVQLIQPEWIEGTTLPPKAGRVAVNERLVK
jgi:LacI family transcriptional regulator